MKCYFTIVENILSESYRKACWEIWNYFENRDDNRDSKQKFVDATGDIIGEFPEMARSNAAGYYIIADDISGNYATFTIEADRVKTCEIMQFVIRYAQQHNLILLAADYLYRPNGTMCYFSKVKESIFPPTEKWGSHNKA
ncbi:MAG: hypothetical protein RR705_00045 [Lachnospiraceae bacterium]